MRFKLRLREAFIILVIAGLSVSLVKFFSRKAGVWQVVRAEVVSEPEDNPRFWLSEAVKAGDVELGVDGSQIAQVLKVESYERRDGKVDIYLILKLKTEFNGRMKEHVFKGKAVTAGETINLRLNQALVKVRVLDEAFRAEEREEKEVVVQGRWVAQEPWRVSQIKAGEVMRAEGSGEAVAEGLSVWSEPGTSQAAIRMKAGGELVFTSSPRAVDGVVRLKLKAVKQGEDWYFAEAQKLKVGEFIDVFLPEIDVTYLEVTSIEPVN